MSRDPPISDLHAHIGYWLRMVSNAVSQSFARKIAAQGVTVAEWVFLRMMYDVDAIAPSALAGRMGMTRGAISKLADRLVDKGLIVRIANPDDGRAHVLALTSTARALAPRLAAIADHNDAEFFADLAADEREVVERVLRTIVQRHALSPPTE